MPRLKLQALASYRFTCTQVVRTTDLNYGGHLGNDRLLSLVHEARVAFLAHHGLSELDFAGVSLIMADAAVVYQAEAHAGDRLVFAVEAAEPTRSGFRIFYRVTGEADGQAIALVENGMACFDYHLKKIAPLPDAVKRSGFFQEQES
jgi:acyl-CoA thioesterase FadM